jgi:hypothetical protein
MLSKGKTKRKKFNIQDDIILLRHVDADHFIHLCGVVSWTPGHLQLRDRRVSTASPSKRSRGRQSRMASLLIDNHRSCEKASVAACGIL